MENQTAQSSDNHQKLTLPDVDPRNFARSYQIEALEKAKKQNTIVFLETGSGKTLIAIMLIRSYDHLIRKPSPFVAVFLVPTVHLVTQQAGVVKRHTDLKVGMYGGALGVDFWDASIWKEELATHEVLVMTPRILLDALRHGFYKLDIIKLLFFDECHNARGNSDYACILKEFYHPHSHLSPTHLPRILGMTACLVKSTGPISPNAYAKQILDFENLMNSKDKYVTHVTKTEIILGNLIKKGKNGVEKLSKTSSRHTNNYCFAGVEHHKHKPMTWRGIRRNKKKKQLGNVHKHKGKGNAPTSRESNE